MDEQDWLAEQFETRRAHLRAVAYRMLGSGSDADDAVQEAWLRVSRAASAVSSKPPGRPAEGRIRCSGSRSRAGRSWPSRSSPTPKRAGTRRAAPLSGQPIAALCSSLSWMICT